MIFNRSHKIPLYGGRLYVIFCDSLKEAEEHTKLEFEAPGSDLDDYDGGCFQRGQKHYVMFEHDPEPSVIAHECKHFVNHVFMACGIELDRFNDEPECYLLGWAVDKVYSAMEKMKKEDKGRQWKQLKTFTTPYLSLTGNTGKRLRRLFCRMKNLRLMDWFSISTTRMCSLKGMISMGEY